MAVSAVRLRLRTILHPSLILLIRKEVLPRYRMLVASIYKSIVPIVLKNAFLNSGSAFSNLIAGHVLFKLGRAKEAILYYEKSIAIKPNLFKAHSQLELLYRLAEQTGKKDSKGNQLFDHRTYDLERSSLDRLLLSCRRMVETFPNSVEANFKMGNALIMANGNREEASCFFYKASTLRLQATRKKGHVGLIFAATLHRSGTGYLKRALINGLKLPKDAPDPVPCTVWWYPEITIAFPPFALSMQPILDGISVGHTAALPSNLTILNLCVDRLIVNVRDPRQGLMSYVHYLHYFKYTNNIEGLLESHIPENYFLLALEDQINWQIDHFYLPAAIKWIEGWLDAGENRLFYPKILYTTHEELASNLNKYFDSILSFYEIDRRRFVFPEAPRFERNTPMRRGSTDEWRKVFTPEQAARASQLIPKRLYDKFGWDRG